MKELPTLLLPPMKNIVRRLVIECAADGCDVVRKACKMSLDDVVHELKDEAVWFDGFDWLERRRNDRLGARKTEQRTRIMDESSSSDDSSLSSQCDRSTTSPMTPSPPPKEAILIPVSPIFDPPRLLRPIPYIPESLINLPEQSLEVFQGIWRAACRPLYHCRCKICKRAKAAERVVQIAPEDTAQPVTAAAEIPPLPCKPSSSDESFDGSFEDALKTPHSTCAKTVSETISSLKRSPWSLFDTILRGGRTAKLMSELIFVPWIVTGSFLLTNEHPFDFVDAPPQSTRRAVPPRVQHDSHCTHPTSKLRATFLSPVLVPRLQYVLQQDHYEAPRSPFSMASRSSSARRRRRFSQLPKFHASQGPPTTAARTAVTTTTPFRCAMAAV
ncbi:hypothetical protein IW261DRAFT_1597680 [Armillaria novae-zelandiae]|uniref:Uncharacterized protein n=1 Tax=Armillaria novae-zelandiae TaxID=153914 RepID=A0AA39NSJ6_9AGAR|nr:hypothetical protein IW261DRAFT_1597680 [Armillaria novae-zelandiae]